VGVAPPYDKYEDGAAFACNEGRGQCHDLKVRVAREISHQGRKLRENRAKAESGICPKESLTLEVRDNLLKITGPAVKGIAKESWFLPGSSMALLLRQQNWRALAKKFEKITPPGRDGQY